MGLKTCWGCQKSFSCKALGFDIADAEMKGVGWRRVLESETGGEGGGC